MKSNVNIAIKDVSEYTSGETTNGHAARYISSDKGPPFVYALQSDKSLNNICLRKLGQPSKFAKYPDDKLVFFSIMSSIGCVQTSGRGKRNINPGEVYPDTAAGAKAFERNMAFAKVELLDLTANVEHTDTQMLTVFEDWKKFA